MFRLSGFRTLNFVSYKQGFGSENRSSDLGTYNWYKSFGSNPCLKPNKFGFLSSGF
ncbi:hypothetical protein HanRHA438_Chr02g0051641 [Helianthus annuus]|nr:hypothetical protein HanIR_Chr02g0056391 [Helianthus annuus]KAJ0938604.1 hypothetical protein HanRHA438_Chr02g0051641 [Helianthus annuus]